MNQILNFPRSLSKLSAPQQPRGFSKCPCTFSPPNWLPVKQPLQRRRADKAHFICNAGASEVFEVADVISIGKSLIGLGTGVSILAALTWSSLPLLSSSKEALSTRNADDEDAIGVKWGVMSVLSFIPLFNWLAWIFAAFEDEDRASFYYLLAFLYGVPQLNAGFQQNWFSLATLAAGILHVQAERLADEKGIKQRISLDSGLQDTPAQASKFIKNTSRTFADAMRNNLDEKELREEEDRKDSSAEELKQWDQRFKSKDKG